MGGFMAVADGATSYYAPPEPPPIPPPPPAEVPAGTCSVEAKRTAPAAIESPTNAGDATPQCAPSGPYALPQGSTVYDTVHGTQAQPFDVTLSQLASSVYADRGPPPAGWTAITDDDLRANGVGNPEAWRETFLGSNESSPGEDGKQVSAGDGEKTTLQKQEFRAEIYRDCQGNFVLSYRGTEEGAADWENNFRQGLGYETTDGDKFATSAANTAVEFERVFGNGDEAVSTNLAITGHSQGGGLASVGSLASGVPAVTFDASGIHPNTLDRMGLDPQLARDVAEGGQIRAYSLSSDALTQAQDSWATGVIAPDALGTQVVVDPAAADVNNMFRNYGPEELKGMSADQINAINLGVELARNPVTSSLLSAPVGLVGGTLVGGLLGGPSGAVLLGTGGSLLAPVVTQAGGKLAYAAISHSPHALTNAMIDCQPWQAGYENPSTLGRDVQDLLPDELKDDFARNTHDFATDVDAVVATDFADGDALEGVVSLGGDLAEGFFNSAGDTVDRYADTFAGVVDDRVGGMGGDVLSSGIDFAGDVAETQQDLLGQVSEWLADGAAPVAQVSLDASVTTTRAVVESSMATAEIAVRASIAAADTAMKVGVAAVENGVAVAKATAEVVVVASTFVANAAVDGASIVAKEVVEGVGRVVDGVSAIGESVASSIESVGGSLLDTAKGVARKLLG